MSSGGKGSAAQSKNYYGTVSVAFCWGPLDWLRAIICNGNYIFQGSLDLTDDVTDLTGSLLDPTLIAPGGYLKLYRGTETQPADPAMVGHPPDKGTVKVVGKHIFFGQDSGTAPNLRLIGGRLPRVPTSIVAAEDNFADDDQVNPFAALAEYLLDERGGKVPEAMFNAASWRAAAAWCTQDQAHIDFTFCSPFVAEQGPLRDVARKLLEPFNGFCRWTNSAVLAAGIYEWAVDPGGLPLFDARHWTERPNIPLGDWDDVPTEVLATFTNRDFEYQGDSHLVPNARAEQIRQEIDQKTLDRPFVTRPAQIHQHVVEYIRRIGTAPSTATIKVRRPFISALSVGDKIKVNTDPEPAGDGLAQLVQVKRIEQDAGDVATLTVLTDNLVPASAYTPVWAPPSPAAPASPPLVYFLGVPLPPAAFGLPRAVGILATRPSAAVNAMEVFFSDAHTNPFDEMGVQQGFAVRAQLAADIVAADGTINLTELDGLDGPDAGLAAHTPGGNPTAAENNTLIALLCSLDGDGRIALDGDGDPVMEFVSIQDRAVVSGATYGYTVLRGRLGTVAQDWASGAVAWITPLSNLAAWRHELFDGLAGSPAFFRLVSETPRAVDDTIPVPECSVNMLPNTAPSVVAGVQDVFFSFIFKRASSEPATPTGNSPAGWSDGPPAGSDPLYMSRGVRRISTGILLGTWSDPVRLDGPDGADGGDGTDGADGDSIEVEWSVDGATSWHYPFVPGDIYFHERIGSSGAWSDPIKAVGEDGASGASYYGTAEAVDSFSSSSFTPTGISITATIPAGPRKITLTGNVEGDATLNRAIELKVFRDSTQLGQTIVQLVSAGAIDNLIPFIVLDDPGAGTYIYTVQAARGGGSGGVMATDLTLLLE